MTRPPLPSAAQDHHPLHAVWRRTELRVLLLVLMAAAALWIFLAVTGEVREHETLGMDRRILLAFRTPGNLSVPIGPRWVQESARDFTALGGFTVLTVLTVEAMAILVMHGRRIQAAVLAGTVIFAQFLAEAIKAMVDRPRPEVVPHIDLVYSSSFPSGHALMTPVVYLTLAAIVSAGEKRRGVKLLLLISAVLLTLAVGVSRVYLGVHWPTDVLAGWTLGSAIALAATLVLRWTAPKHGPHAEVAPDAPGAA
jgi:undecaprenyl-diphosphatase